ncbi:kinase-like protein [Rickenella mellea]|uniref:Kinase-like protein n=1 Tax=Rickenella mellea TaxID=50990 RepID=A0A4Y7PYX3_9AGAM|nr:kinase-like protein [Rickenella mellea]
MPIVSQHFSDFNFFENLPDLTELDTGSTTHSTKLAVPCRDPKFVVKRWLGHSGKRAGLMDLFENLLAEILRSWKRLHHPNVVRFIGITSDANLPDPHWPVSLVLPYYKNGNVNDFVRLQKDHLTDHFLLDLAKGIARGLGYMHSLDDPVCHGNVRGVNILINDSGEPLISDVGLSSLAEDPQFDGYIPNFAIKHCRWLAPEIMVSGTELAKSASADVYSYGMTLLEMYDEEMPYPELGDYAVIRKVTSGERPTRPPAKFLTDEIWDIIKKCTMHAAIDRPAMACIFNYLEKI